MSPTSPDAHGTAPSPSPRPVRPVDAVALQRAKRRLEAASEPPWLHAEVARRMLERVPLVRRAPRRVIDWWPRAGTGGVALAEHLPQARLDQLVAGEPPRRSWPRWLGGGRVSAVAAATAGAYDLVWANMLLHHEADPPSLIRAWQSACAVDGFLMFSTLGPGTLARLRDVYRTLGWGSPMAPLVDMHDLGDMLVAAGFADPVMDQEVLRLSWRDAGEALAELHSLGANADPQRHPGLRTPRWRQRLLQALAAQADGDARVVLEFEVVYGHAVQAPQRFRVEPESRIGVDALRATLRRSQPR